MPGSLVLLSTDFQGKGGSSQGIPTVSQDKASCSWFIIVPFPVDVEDHTGFPNVPGEAPPPAPPCTHYFQRRRWPGVQEEPGS